MSDLNVHVVSAPAANTSTATRDPNHSLAQLNHLTSIAVLDTLSFNRGIVDHLESFANFDVASMTQADVVKAWRESIGPMLVDAAHMIRGNRSNDMVMRAEVTALRRIIAENNVALAQKDEKIRAWELYAEGQKAEHAARELQLTASMEVIGNGATARERDRAERSRNSVIVKDSSAA